MGTNGSGMPTFHTNSLAGCSDPTVTGRTNVSNGTIFMVTGVRKSVNVTHQNLSIYVNGVHEGSTITTNCGNVSNGGQFKIGANSFQKGIIDGFGIWEGELTQNEITNLYNSNTGLDYPFISPITLNSPTNASFVLVNANTTFNWFSNITGLVNTTLYLNDILNQTINITGNSNSTTIYRTFSSNGAYNWTVTSCTASLCVNSSTYNFTVNPYIINYQIYSNTTQETLSEIFSLNITLANGSSLTAGVLNWNGTNYSGSIGAINLFRELNNSITMPTITSQQNITLYWYLIIDGNTFTTTPLYQIINTLLIDNCTVHSRVILNYTVNDENNRTRILTTQNITADVYVKLTGDLSGTIYEYTGFRSTNNTIPICVSNALLSGENYKLDSEVQYTANNYVTEYYYIDNYTLNTTVAPVNISLYLLDSLSSQEFLITYKDKYQLPVNGAFIELTRQYLNIPGFLTVEIGKTDSDGQTVEHFIINDQVYTIYIKKNGVLLATFENVRAFCKDILTGDCTINLNELYSTTNPSDFSSSQGVILNPTYNKTTKVYTLEFTGISQTTHNVTVNILKYNPYLNESICLSSLTSSSGTLTCTIPSTYYNDTGIVNIYVDGTIVSSVPLQISFLNANSNSSKYILAFIIMASLPLLGLSSGVMTLILFLVGLVTVSSLYLIDLGGLFGKYSAFLWFVVAVGIILIKSARKKEQV